MPLELKPQVSGNIQAIEGLNPGNLWAYFAALNEYPRDSLHEAPALSALKEWAEAMGFECRQDSANKGNGNLCIHVPASEGISAAPVILQAHIDMVCVKRPDSTHDFSKDPIELVRNGDSIKAKDTSLGADNLLGVAAAMAVASDPTAVHPPLQIVITVDEEGDFTGANELNAEELGITGRHLVNLDTESASTLISASAAYRDISGKAPLERENPELSDGNYFELKLTGFAGGHSGLDADKGRGNANIVFANILKTLEQKGIRIVSVHGGEKPNSLSAFAEAVIVAPSTVSLEELNRELAPILVGLRETYKDKDGQPNAHISLALTPMDNEAMRAFGVITRNARNRFFDVLGSLPEGILTRSENQATQGSPETSSNLGSMRIGRKKNAQGEDLSTPDEMEMLLCARAYGDEAVDQVASHVRDVLSAQGFTSEFCSTGGSWVGDLESPLSRAVLESFNEVDGKSGKVERVFGTLEIASLISKLRGKTEESIDAVSFGTTILNQHSVSEEVFVSHTARFYEQLCTLLRRLAVSLN